MNNSLSGQIALIEALGIPAKNLAALDIQFRPGNYPIAIAQYYVKPDSTISDVETIIKKFQLVEIVEKETAH